MKHLDELREALAAGKKLQISAAGNPEAIDVAMTQIKEKYKEYSDKAGTFVMHEWAQEDRKQFFKLFIAYYLSYETEIARNGMPPGD